MTRGGGGDDYQAIRMETSTNKSKVGKLSGPGSSYIPAIFSAATEAVERTSSAFASTTACSRCKDVTS